MGDHVTKKISVETRELRQKHFDKAIKALLKQGKPCKNSAHCMYFHDGERCAIGWLLTKPQAIKAEARHSCSPVKDLGEFMAIEWMQADWQFYNDLQSTHDFAEEYCEGDDNNAWLMSFHAHAIDFAKKYKLNTKVLD